MKTSCFAVMGAIVLFGSPALAQNKDTGPGASSATSGAHGSIWQGGLELSVTPRIGRQQPFDTSEDVVDESETELVLSFKRPNTVGSLPLALKAGLTWSPQYFDDSDPQSGIYGEIGVGDSYLPLSRLAFRRGTAAPTAIDDGFRPYASYRYTSVRQAFLDARVRDEHQITAGLRYRDIRSIMCQPNAVEGVTPCGTDPGVSWEARAEVKQIWSSDPAEERTAPSVRADLISRPRAGGIRFFARAQVEARFYDSARASPSGEHRQDWILRLTPGINLTGLIQHWLRGPELELGGQLQRRWSNDPGRRNTRFYFVPSLSFSGSF
jgi:hypothetical protein